MEGLLGITVDQHEIFLVNVNSCLYEESEAPKKKFVRVGRANKAHRFTEMPVKKRKLFSMVQTPKDSDQVKPSGKFSGHLL